jgi:hypothetical protein
MTYAILNANRRVVEFVAHEPINVDWVKTKPGDGAAIGRIYNGWTFDGQKWTPLEFLSRFTEAELDEIEMRRLSDQNVRTFYRTASFAQEVVADDPRTIAGMEYLVSVGLLTAARKEEILNG